MIKGDSKNRRSAPRDRPFTREEIERYDRQLVLPEVGLRGQKRLRSASVLLVGAGGLGSAAALYLAAAGIGRLGIADSDVVGLSNLQRQVLHHTPDLGRPKPDSAAETITSLNENVEVVTHNLELTSGNARELVGQYDIIIDGTDNYPARYFVNDACCSLGLPMVYGAVFRFEGQVSVFDSLRGPCYRCLYPEPPPSNVVPSCADAGVLGALPGVIGTLQASEAIKLVLNAGTPLVGRLLVFDALAASFKELQIQKDPGCGACGAK